MDENVDKIIDKIRKLVALTDSPNEHEAARAAERVQSLLAQHNLSMTDIGKKKDNFVIDPELTSLPEPWRRGLGTAVATLYFCSYFYASEKHDGPKTRYIARDRHHFVGALHNIAVSKLMFVYLTKTVDRLAREGAAKVEKKEFWSYQTSFKIACSSRLTQRIAERIRLAKEVGIKTETGTTLPALASLYDSTKRELTEFLDGARPELETKKVKMRPTNLAGMVDGYAAGDKIGLDAQVKGQGAAHLLGQN